MAHGGSVLLDLSGSLKDTQRREWADEIRSRVQPRLGSCDSLLALGVHEASITAAPIFRANTPGPRNPESLILKLQILRETKAAGDRFAGAVESASRGQGGALRTDLIGALHRAGPTGNRATRILIFSDMEHVADDLNLESTPLAGRIDRVVKSVIARRAWSADRFQNATVAAVLPGERGRRTRANSRETLREFWTALFAATGGRVASFENYIGEGTF